MKLFSRTLRVGILGLALTLLNCQQLMDLLDEKNKVDDTAASTNTDLDKAGSWTILVYLDAANNLEGAGVQDVMEMRAMAANLGGNKIYVLMDRMNGFSTAPLTGAQAPLTTDFNGASLFQVETNGNLTPVAATPWTGFNNTDPSIDEVNMGAEDTLTKFLTWGYNKAKTDTSTYIYVDIWDHGAGWGGGAYGGNAVAWDDETGPPHDALSITEIQNAMKAAEAATSRKATILGFDACYMGTMENAYSFKDRASIMIGSEEVEPGAGWDYEFWTPRGSVSPRTVASNVVTTFKTYYSSSGEQVTLAAYDLSKIAGVSTALEAFLTKIGAQPSTAISSARQQSQSYNNDMSVDLYDFVDKMNMPESAALKNMIKSLMVAEAHTAGGKVDRSYGVTVYFPQSSSNYDSTYNNTVFAQSTKWDEFISGKLASFEVSSTEPGDTTCGAESNDTASKANLIGSGGTTGCTGYIYTSSDVDIYKFSGGALTSAGTFDITLTNIPAGADFDVLLFNTDISPSAPIASGSISSGNNSEGFQYSPSNGIVTYNLNGSFQCNPANSTSTYVKQGLCYGQGFVTTSSSNFYIVIIGKNNSYNQTGKYTLTLGKTGTVTLP